METSPVKRRRGGRRSGVTLVEMLVTLGLLSVVMGTVTGMILRTQREYTRQREAIRLQENMRNAEMVIARLLRTAAVDPLGLSIGRVDIDPLAHGTFDNVRVRSDFNPADGDVLDALEDALVYTSDDTLYVRWQAGAVPQPIAYPVRSLLFEYFAADDTPITSQALIANAAKAKYTVTAPAKPGDAAIKSRIAWVHFRN